MDIEKEGSIDVPWPHFAEMRLVPTVEKLNEIFGVLLDVVLREKVSNFDSVKAVVNQLTNYKIKWQF